MVVLLVVSSHYIHLVGSVRHGGHRTLSLNVPVIPPTYKLYDGENPQCRRIGDADYVKILCRTWYGYETFTDTLAGVSKGIETAIASVQCKRSAVVSMTVFLKLCSATNPEVPRTSFEGIAKLMCLLTR